MMMAIPASAYHPSTSSPQKTSEIPSIKLTERFGFGFNIYFLSTAKHIKIVLQAILVRALVVWAGQAYTDKSCSQKPDEKGEVRGQSFTLSYKHRIRCWVVTTHYGSVTSWKTGEKMGWKKALQIFLWKWIPEGKKRLFRSVSFPFMHKPGKMFWFSGILENSNGNQDSTH